MQNTLGIFEDRKEELELYYSIMYDLDNGSPTIKTINNSRFFRILKSNYILMLYNLVEACMVSGIVEIYDSLRNDNCTYDDVIDEIKTIWANSQIAKIYGPTTQQVVYENRVKRIIEDITRHNPIILSKEELKFSGNLDARRIKALCDKHKIRYVANDDNAALQKVKDKRNSLAHGDVSFSDCARDLTLSDLSDIKTAVLDFMTGILTGMEKYFNEKGYKIDLG